MPVEQGIRSLAKQKCTVPILDLRGRRFSLIPDEISSINGLEELYLDSNELSVLPDSIGKIEHLRILSLGRNRFTKLPVTLIDRWATLTTLFLGHNQISSLCFTEEDLWAFSHGSIGSNPLPEPIGRHWMVKKDATQIPVIMKEMVPPTIQPKLAKLFADQIIHIIDFAGEPMVYECLFENIKIRKDGTILWNQHFDRPWLRYIAVSIIPNIVRGAIIDSSLWRWNINHLSMQGIPEVPLILKEQEDIILSDIK